MNENQELLPLDRHTFLMMMILSHFGAEEQLAFQLVSRYWYMVVVPMLFNL